MKKLLILPIIAVSINSTYADDFVARPYLGVDYGIAKLSDETTSTAQSLVSSLGGSATVTQSSSVTNYRFFGGYELTENLGLELGYSKSSDVTLAISGTAGNTYSNVSYSGSFATAVSGLDYSMLLRPSIASGINGLFLRIGGHNFTQKTSGSITVSTKTVTSNTSESGNGLLYGFGYDTKIGKGLDFRLEYRKLNDIAGDSSLSATFYTVGIKKSW
jgi:hypothetical protein